MPPNSENPRLAQLEALRALLVPITRFCLKRNLSIQDLISASKSAFIETGQEVLSAEGKKVNVSRLSVLTGLYRADVYRLYREKEELTEEPKTITGRVLSHWNHHPRFTTTSGQPRTLTFRGERNDFTKLCDMISKTINPGTVLFELERSGLAERTKRGLRQTRRLVSLRESPEKAYQSLGTQIDCLLQAIEENLLPEERIDNMHFFTDFNNIYESDVPKVRKWLVTQGRFFHRKIRKFLSRFDKDLNPKADSNKLVAGKQVSVGSFSFTK